MARHHECLTPLVGISLTSMECAACRLVKVCWQGGREPVVSVNPRRINLRRKSVSDQGNSAVVGNVAGQAFSTSSLKPSNRRTSRDFLAALEVISVRVG